jgi:hypothetical protein
MFGTSGSGQRRMLMYMIMQQEQQQAELRAREERERAEAERQFNIERDQTESRLQQERLTNKKLRTEETAARLGGMVGFRSLLSGNKGGGGFGPRSMMNAA